jgi:NADH pyrophosphatase NudC (nudix superfamily)
MDIGSIFLLLGLFILVGLYISRPFLIHRATIVTKEDRIRSSLLAEKERLLNALQELDFDYTLGKIPAADYPEQREALLAETVQVMKQLDALLAEGNGGSEVERIETALANRLQTKPRRAVVTDAPPDDELESLIATRRRERMEKAAGFCPQCGKPVQLSDRFCPKCGTPLQVGDDQTV